MGGGIASHRSRNHLLAFLLWAGLLLSTAPAWAAEDPLDSEFKVVQLTTNDGLPQNTVASITQTDEGYLWLGTWLGLARYDGTDFVQPGPVGTPGMAGSGVSALARDGRGGLWIGTTKGLYALPQRGAVPQAEPSIQQACLAVAVAGEAVVVGGQWGLAWGRPGAWRQAPGDLWVRSAAVASNSQVWLGARQGLARLARPLESNAPVVVVPGRRHTAVVVAGDAVWASVDADLLELEAATARVRRRWPGVQVEPWLVDGAGRLWVSCRSQDGQALVLGTWDATRGEVRPLATGFLPRKEEITCGFEDSAGTLWFGTRTSGILRLGRVDARIVDERHGLPSDDVWAISASADGGLWIQTRHGPARRVGDHFEAVDWPREEDSSHGILALSGREALAAGKSLRRIRDRHASVEAGPGPVVDFMVEDRRRRRVAGGPGGIWWREAEGPWVPVADLPKTALWIGWEVGASNEVFAGSLNQGLWERVGDGAWQRVALKGDPAAAAVLWWEDGRWPWAGSDRGLYRRNEKGQWDRWTTAEGLLENLVMAMQPDPAGRLWLLGHQGITRVAIADLKAVARGQAGRLRPRLMAGPEGLTSTEGNSGSPASTREPDGTLWFATTRGAVRLRPGDLPAPAPPVPVIEEARDLSLGPDSVPISPGAPSVFGGGSGRAWIFRFTAPFPSAGHRVHLEYRLEGFDGSWRVAGRRREASYAGLKPGPYRFQVRAAADDGPWNPQVASWGFEVRPRWWERTDARAAGALAGLAFLGGLVGRRLRLQRRLADLQRAHAVEDERRRLARDLHDGLGSELARLNLAAAHGGVDLGRISRDLLHRLQTLVWLTDPAEDRLDSLARSMASRVERFFPRGRPAVRVEMPAVSPSRPVDGRWRRELTAWLDEGLANIARHARAQQVRLRIDVLGDQCHVLLVDDGCGFDLAELRAGGRGLGHLRLRIASLGGRMEVRSAPGEGTALEAWIPLPSPPPTGHPVFPG